jgi:hypothetical protein
VAEDALEDDFDDITADEEEAGGVGIHVEGDKESEDVKDEESITNKLEIADSAATRPFDSNGSPLNEALRSPSSPEVGSDIYARTPTRRRRATRLTITTFAMYLLVPPLGKAQVPQYSRIQIKL